MPDEYLIGIGIVGKQPPVPIGSAAVNLSGPNSHAVIAPSSPTLAAQRSSPQWCAPAGCWQRAELRIAGAAAQTRGLRNSAVWFFGLSCHQRTTRPPAFGYPAKDQAKAGGQ